MNTNLYFDESGYTGPDLTNVDQPFFILASTILSDEDSKTILEASFPEYKADEFKFKQIWKYGGHRKRIENLSKYISKRCEEIHIWQMDKRFTLLVKCIDYLIEPLFTGNGYDFYAPWYAQSYCNTVYRDLTKNGSDLSRYNELTAVWNHFARFPTPENLERLREFFSREKRDNAPPISTIFDTLLSGLEYFKEREAIKYFHDTNDIQFTSVLGSLSWWRQKIPDEFCIYHDQSNNFFAQKTLWDAITSNEQPAGTHTLGNATTLDFPLGITQTIAANSKDSPSIQLCDLVAGFAAKLLAAKQANALTDLMAQSLTDGFGELTIGGSAPDDRYVTGLPPKRSGPDALDKMLEVLRPGLPTFSQ